MNQAELDMKRVSRRSFLWAGAAVIGGVTGVRALAGATKRADGDIPNPFRRGLETNEAVAKRVFDQHAHVPTFKPSDVTELRVNGTEGLPDEFDPQEWEMTLKGLGAERTMKLDDLKRLPRAEQITQFCCIEGWSAIQSWAGVRLIDVIREYSPKELPEYVSMTTADGGYYVGLDRAAATHPQTLLAYERNGQPLEVEHGGPVRLVIPVKYGVKNLKRVGVIEFTDERPADYWGERGYDWFAGL